MRWLVSRVVVLCRWAMAPLFVGLALALGLLVFTFLRDLWYLTSHLTHISDTQLIMGLLTLIDLILVGGLMVVVILSGFENFVERIERVGTDNWPEWTTRISFSGLKLKLFASLMAISGITLLKALMKLEESTSEAQVKWLVVANIIFIAGYAVLALTDRLIHSHKERG